MDIENLNIYQRLRDFKVPNVILDEILSNEEDMDTLKASWKELESSGLPDDEIAEAIAKTILNELGDDLIQSLEDDSNEM